MKNRDGCSVTAAIPDVLLRGTGMVRQKRAFTPLEIPLLEAEAKESLTGRVSPVRNKTPEVSVLRLTRISNGVKRWDKKRTPLEKQVKQSLTGRRFLTGFTVIELILIVIFIGAFAAISIPRLNFAIISRNKADVVARKIVTDLRRTRRMAISDAANNTVGYRLRMVPPSPYTSYEIENLDTGAIIDLHTIDSTVSCTGDLNFRFGPLGNLTNVGQTQITVAAGGKSFTITIIPATGTIKCVEN